MVLMDNVLAKKLALEAFEINLTRAQNDLSEEDREALTVRVGEAGELLTESLLGRTVEDSANDLLWIKLDNSPGWLFDEGFKHFKAKRPDYLLGYDGRSVFFDSKFKTFSILPGNKFRVTFSVSEIEQYQNLGKHFGLPVTLIVWVRKSFTETDKDSFFVVIIHLEHLNDENITSDNKYYFVDTSKADFSRYSFPE